ncbi:hypothetical protein ACFWIA_34395 [Streptomyces sp. NPDC127068]|uniref:hypothetical protein n=1 Tax=Streptomyces sp. NPDC127068 TaxID=3347127 RepID=UPI00364CB9A5
MRIRLLAQRSTGVAVALAALSLTGTGVAPAATGPEREPAVLAVRPTAAPPGTEVALTVTGCPGTTARARSDAFVAPADLAPAPRGTGLFAEARLRSGAAPGPYGITVSCAGRDHVVPAAVRVAAPGRQGGPGQGEPDRPGEPAATPTAPVSAGGGGAPGPEAEDREDTGPGLRQAVVGLVLACVAALVVVGRGVRARRPDGDRNPSS